MPDLSSCLRRTETLLHRWEAAGFDASQGRRFSIPTLTRALFPLLARAAGALIGKSLIGAAVIFGLGMLLGF